MAGTPRAEAGDGTADEAIEDVAGAAAPRILTR
jgi:hypothetical protein